MRRGGGDGSPLPEKDNECGPPTGSSGGNRCDLDDPPGTVETDLGTTPTFPVVDLGQSRFRWTRRSPGFFAGKEKIEGRGTYLGFGSGSA
jgi:hypothetical protein